MYKKYLIHVLALIFLSLYCITGVSQNEISSPYSSFGVGILNHRSNGIINSMGGSGYGIQSPYQVNFKNPASYSVFDSLSFIADASFGLYGYTQTTSNMVQKNSRARFDYLAIGLPITKYWGTSLGVLPFSDLGYNISDSANVDNVGTANYRYAGEGGLMQVYWGNGFKLNKQLSIGVNLSYLWGNFNTLRFMEFDNTTIHNSKVAQIKNIDGLRYSLGLQYKFDLQSERYLTIGIVYENSAYIATKDNILITNYSGEYENTTSFDTVLIKTGDNAVKGTLKIPQFIGGGLTYNYKEKYLLSADCTWQNWSNFSGTGIDDSLTNNFISSVGFQYTPDSKSTKYLQKVSYRAGVRYSTGYMIVKGSPISDYVFSVGAGFPLKTFNTRSSLNILLEYGSMGTITNGLINENYVRLSLNFILHEKWYQRVKLN
jgi:hypothetical protein